MDGLGGADDGDADDAALGDAGQCITSSSQEMDAILREGRWMSKGTARDSTGEEWVAGTACRPVRPVRVMVSVLPGTAWTWQAVVGSTMEAGRLRVWLTALWLLGSMYLGGQCKMSNKVRIGQKKKKRSIEIDT